MKLQLFYHGISGHCIKLTGCVFQIVFDACLSSCVPQNTCLLEGSILSYITYCSSTTQRMLSKTNKVSRISMKSDQSSIGPCIAVVIQFISGYIYKHVQSFCIVSGTSKYYTKTSRTYRLLVFALNLLYECFCL